jgi:signal transduction histidine kinase
MIPEKTLPEDYSQLLKKYQELQQDYEHLNVMFENMGLGYEDALMLYDKAVESSRMKSDFIRQISHEIRTPLNILSGFTQILTSGMELDEAVKDEVSRGIADNTQRIAGLVNKMLELAQSSSEAEIECSDDVLAVQIAVQAVDKSCIMMASHLHFELQIAPEAESTMLHTNLQHATRALELLLDNAMKFTHPAESAGGSKAVKELAHVLLSIQFIALPTQPSSQLAFIVEDTGIGVPPEEAEHIFEEFVQLDQYYDGTGIGLTVARSIARRLGGDIVLDSAYHEGARFVFTLPLA